MINIKLSYQNLIAILENIEMCVNKGGLGRLKIILLTI